ECPPRYLVAECMTRSAPRSSGFWRKGVAKVLSTPTSILCSFAILETATMSMIFIIGLVGVSIQISLVFSVIYSLTFSGSSMETKLNLMPYLANTLVNILYDPPYRSLELIISSPGLNNLTMASMAPSPEEKHRPCLPFSRAARLFCRAVLVGLWVREYSYPLWSPGDFWT